MYRSPLHQKTVSALIGQQNQIIVAVAVAVSEIIRRGGILMCVLYHRVIT